VVDFFASAPAWSLPEAAVAELAGAAPDGWEASIVHAPTISDGDGGALPSAEALQAIADADAYAGFGISLPLFRAARRLRWVHSAAAGVASLLSPEVLAADVLLTNSAGVHAIPIAETVLGGVLYLLRGLDLAIGLQRAGVWDSTPFVGADTPLRELAECHPLILGAGGIGTAVAQRLAALGARCTGIRRHPELGAPEGFDHIAAPQALDDLLPDHDLLIITAPATSETRDLVTAARLDRLPRGAIVVNVARGTLLDEHALAERVAAGYLRGAVLDVFRDEPLPVQSPLWRLPAVLITPHVSGVSPRGFWRREMELLIDNWRRYADGRPLRNVVDQRAGY
jgi:phosphoglycerate dehydrogenase-like enzyme